MPLRAAKSTNFDARMPQFDHLPLTSEDIFIAHIAAMDFAAVPRALLIAADILDTASYERCVSPNVTPPTTQAKAGFF